MAATIWQGILFQFDKAFYLYNLTIFYLDNLTMAATDRQAQTGLNDIWHLRFKPRPLQYQVDKVHI